MAACTSTQESVLMAASSCRQLYAVRNTVGMVAASVKVTAGGLATSAWPLQSTAEPRQPAAWPNTASPTLQTAPSYSTHVQCNERITAAEHSMCNYRSQALAIIAFRWASEQRSRCTRCVYLCSVLRLTPTAAMMPATSPPGSPGSLPGYIPRTFSTSRKFSPIALTVSNTCA